VGPRLGLGGVEQRGGDAGAAVTLGDDERDDAARRLVASRMVRAPS
jgi:hypothetical protein